MTRLHDVFFDCSKLTVEQLGTFGDELARYQRGINFWIGDCARYARYVLRLGDNYSQVFPPWMSPGLIQRCEAVAVAYPTEAERNPLASWSTHMQHAKHPDRVKLVAESVNAGRTSDEERVHTSEEKARTRWLLAVDVSYYVHRFWFSGAGVEAATGVADWVRRTVDRLKEKGLTDVVCCLDSRENNRKKLTETWTDKYKDRPPRDPELSRQLQLVVDLLREAGFACVGVEGQEADDVMASYAKQFAGRVTLLTQDKDCRQCLGATCNMLRDVEWVLDEHSADLVPTYHWLTAKAHTDETGLTPSQWIEYQILRGDNTDGIRGAEWIGEKGANELIRTFATADGAIAAARAGDERIREVKRAALIAFADKLVVTRKLVTLRTDLVLPTTTRLT